MNQKRNKIFILFHKPLPTLNLSLSRTHSHSLFSFLFVLPTSQPTLLTLVISVKMFHREPFLPFFSLCYSFHWCWKCFVKIHEETRQARRNKVEECTKLFISSLPFFSRKILLEIKWKKSWEKSSLQQCLPEEEMILLIFLHFTCLSSSTYIRREEGSLSTCDLALFWG